MPTDNFPLIFKCFLPIAYWGESLLYCITYSQQAEPYVHK